MNGAIPLLSLYAFTPCTREFTFTFVSFCPTFFLMWLCAVTAKRELHVFMDENGFGKI